MTQKNPAPAQRPRKRKCQAITKTGERCKAHALAGEDFCLWHLPGRARQISQKGTAKAVAARQDKVRANWADLENWINVQLRRIRSNKAGLKPQALDASLQKWTAQLIEIAKALDKREGAGQDLTITVINPASIQAEEEGEGAVEPQAKALAGEVLH